MEYLILGLLILSPMSGYELQQFIKENLTLICSHSAGSVQTALAKLKKEEKITVQEQMYGKRRKKIFFITPAGKEAFLIWAAKPMQAGRIKNMELSRLFFLGLAKPEERVTAIREYICQMNEIKATLCAIRERFRDIQTGQLPPGTDWSQILRFQGYTIDYGIAAAEFELNWYHHLLEELERQPAE